jgi:hypothetical protein
LRCVVEIEIKVDFLFVSRENEWSGTLGLTEERERERRREKVWFTADRE